MNVLRSGAPGCETTTVKPLNRMSLPKSGIKNLRKSGLAKNSCVPKAPVMRGVIS